MENGVVNVSRALRSKGFEMHVCCLATGGAFVSRFADADRVRVLGKREGFSFSSVAALGDCIRQVAPDVIHTHNFGPLIYTALARPAAPIVHGEHAELTRSELAPHRRLIRKLLYRRVHRVHTVSSSLRDALIRQGFPAGKIDVVVNGVDADRFSPGSRREARLETGLPEAGFLIGMVGRFGPYKRHGALIDAYERLAQAHPEMGLVIVGAGGPREEATRQRAAASAFAARIHFADLQEDLRPWYRALDLLILPSLNEGLSNALLESMACGVPALAHGACGNRDLIADGENGFLKDLSTVDRLSGELSAVLSNRAALPRMGGAARAAVEARFGFSAMADGYERLYREAAGV
jgi:glycosyltransferase involved in cell wall biosynthesis